MENKTETNKWKHVDISEERKKLRKRKMLSTGLLIFMTITYFILKKLKIDESGSLFCSSLVAFTEASMVGALADWFAVVALFRHPLGMKWIPHTAIIKNSKEKVSSTLSTFVVDNFFTQEKIMSILQDIKVSKNIKLYINNNKKYIINFIVSKIPTIISEISKNKHVRELIIKMINNHLDKIQLSQLAGETLKKILTSNNNNVKLVKYALIFTHSQVEKNQDIIIDYIKQQRFFGFSIPGMIAKNIYSNLEALIDGEIKQLDNNKITGIGKILLDKLDEIPEKLETSEELIDKINHIKEEFIKSDEYNEFINKTLWDLIDSNIVEPITVSCENNPEKVSDAISNFIENIYSDILSSKETCEKIDKWAIQNIESVVSNNRMKIGTLVSNSINAWDEEEMVEKIELMIGSDLQYIRINGTVVGGLVGVIIHLITYFIV